MSIALHNRQSRLATIGGAMVLSVVAIALFAPWLAPYDPLRAVADSFGEPFAPQRAYLLGTDELGRDIFSRLIYGARISLLVAGAATAMTMVIGTSVGLAAGYFGGWVDTTLMRVTDVVLALPDILLALALVALIGPGLASILVVIGLVRWAGIARTVRAEVLTLRERDFMLAATALGASPVRVMLRHLLPNTLPTVVVMTALATSGAIVLDAGLSYLGLGVPVPTPSWGRMLSDSQTFYRTAPWLMVFPGLAIVYAVVAFNFLGHGLLAFVARREG
ncbi:MAG TPA: ABC transporter permease [Candidatus Kryptonia bacterium]|nr:ABC transporter permease [Candidatus Kryptonia bacterium]